MANDTNRSVHLPTRSRDWLRCLSVGALCTVLACAEGTAERDVFIAPSADGSEGGTLAKDAGPFAPPATKPDAGHEPHDDAAAPPVDSGLKDAGMPPVTQPDDAATISPSALMFEVTVPEGTPGGDIYLAANVRGWAPDGVKLSRTGNLAAGVLSVPLGAVVLYKVTRGTWGTVEKAASCAELENRSVSATATSQPVTVMVAAWTDLCK